MKELEVKKDVLNIFKKFLNEIQKSYRNCEDGKFKKWLNEEITSAELVISSLDYETHKTKNDGLLELELSGIEAQIKVYLDALSDCDDKTEGKILDKLIELKKERDTIKSQLDTLDKTTESECINETLVNEIMLSLDIQYFAEKVGIDVFDCANELRDTLERAINKAHKVFKTDVFQDNLAYEESLHFFVKILKKSKNISILLQIK